MPRGRKKHGDGYINDKPLYGVWCVMKQRCFNPKDKRYIYYGHRGVKVCEEWKNDFQAFEKWAISNGYQKGLTVDRINPDGDYSPENCRIATWLQQGENKRNARIVEYKGERMPLAVLARQLNISRHTAKKILRNEGFQIR